ncbi:hypothetical protein ARMGADRAFT_1016768 [Armillaria gallica]|uniref:Uncharacterized protein n=1 Tax=Armillaria gallica TaxID=47427 RepID=A0A2H3DG83_ARMGA|nr:hypothetical protein ARMGADRAFT_1016768 [Armillaria gallica]
MLTRGPPIAPLLFFANVALCSAIPKPTIIQKRDSISQAIRGRPFTPIAFSFGWVSCSFNALMNVLGDGRLVPPPDYPAIVINAQNGYKRDSKSWVLGRLLRDFQRPLRDSVGMTITVFEAVDADSAGIPSVDLWWYSGLLVILVQLGVAAIPCALHQNWSILFITAAGTMLAFATGALPQWRSEKWACRRKTKKVLSVTGGNGTRGVGLDLEDLAAAEPPRMRPRGKDDNYAFLFTQVACLTLATLWIVFLITVTALKQDTWYLLAVGCLGMVQNVLVAGTERHIGTSGIHLEKIEEYQQEEVMDALMDLEEDYPNVGKSLVGELFPSGLHEAETQWWAGSKEGYEKLREEKRPDSLAKRGLVTARAAQARQYHAEIMGVTEKKLSPSAE